MGRTLCASMHGVCLSLCAVCIDRRCLFALLTRCVRSFDFVLVPIYASFLTRMVNVSVQLVNPKRSAVPMCVYIRLYGRAAHTVCVLVRVRRKHQLRSTSPFAGDLAWRCAERCRPQQGLLLQFPRTAIR